jgi:hypothetical protein
MIMDKFGQTVDWETLLKNLCQDITNQDIKQMRITHHFETLKILKD